MLISRQYSARMIDNAFDRLREIQRSVALQKVQRIANKKLTVVFPYDPRMKSVSATVNQQIKHMCDQDSKLKSVFREGVQIAHTRSKNLREYLCRAKLCPLQNRTSQRSKAGWHTCGKKCIICAHSKSTKSFKSTSTGEVFHIEQEITCEDRNVIYLIQCLKCVKSNQYVGRTTQRFVDRMRSHRSDALNSKDTPIGRHFSSNGHNTSHMHFIAIEKMICVGHDRGQREIMWIRILNTIHDGLNNYSTN